MKTVFSSPPSEMTGLTQIALMSASWKMLKTITQKKSGIVSASACRNFRNGTVVPGIFAMILSSIQGLRMAMIIIWNSITIPWNISTIMASGMTIPTKKMTKWKRSKLRLSKRRSPR